MEQPACSEKTTNLISSRHCCFHPSQPPEVSIPSPLFLSKSLSVNCLLSDSLTFYFTCVDGALGAGGGGVLLDFCDVCHPQSEHLGKKLDTLTSQHWT